MRPSSAWLADAFSSLRRACGAARRERCSMTRARVRRLLIASCFAFSGCDFTAGVSRVYRLDEVPLPACVQGTLRSIPGITDVRYAPEDLNQRALHRFSYRAEGVEIRVDIEEKRARPEYLHSYHVFNTVPPKELVARLRPVMAHVDEMLERRCGMRGLSKGAKEYCSRGLFRPTDCER